MIARLTPRNPPRIFLREWRLHRDMTQEELAERIGADKGTLSKWENAKRGMNTDILAELAFALRCTVPDLYRSPEKAEYDAFFASAPDDVRAAMAAYGRGILDGKK